MNRLSFFHVIVESLNYQRELDNREREDEMKQALEEWRKLRPGELRAVVDAQGVASRHRYFILSKSYSLILERNNQ